MRMKRLWLLVCFALLLCASALGEAALTPEKAINVAQALTVNQYLQWELPSLRWTVETDADYGRMYVEGLQQNDVEEFLDFQAFQVFMDLTGRVFYISNGFSNYMDAVVGDPDRMEEDESLAKQLDEYALAFADSLRSGASNLIEGFERPEASYYGSYRYLSVYGLSTDANGAASRTLFVVQVKPEWRVVCYSEGTD
ncbi:MAG: hypothetical protein PHI98_13140 [Eubacteriales bacterium]|nr:hypothetical protein [Eubacteriales bacterium]